MQKPCLSEKDYCFHVDGKRPFGCCVEKCKEKQTKGRFHGVFLRFSLHSHEHRSRRKAGEHQRESLSHKRKIEKIGDKNGDQDKNGDRSIYLLITSQKINLPPFHSMRGTEAIRGTEPAALKYMEGIHALVHLKAREKWGQIYLLLITSQKIDLSPFQS